MDNGVILAELNSLKIDCQQVAKSMDVNPIDGERQFLEDPITPPIGADEKKPFDLERDEDGVLHVVRNVFMSIDELYELEDKEIPEGTKWIWLKTVVESESTNDGHNEKLTHSIELEKPEETKSNERWKPIYKLGDELEVEIDFRTCLYENGLQLRTLRTHQTVIGVEGGFNGRMHGQTHILACSDIDLELATLLRNETGWAIAQGGNVVELCQCDKDDDDGNTTPGEGEEEEEEKVVQYREGTYIKFRKAEDGVVEIDNVGVHFINSETLNIQSEDLEDGSGNVTIELNDEKVVRSVNAQTGEVEIVAGEGVEVKNSGGQIVISIKKDEEEEPSEPDEPIVPGNEPSPSPSGGGGGGGCGCSCDCCSGGDDDEDDSGEDSPCDHPGSSGGPGGVGMGGDRVIYHNYDDGGADFHGEGGSAGGVRAEDEPHEGSDDCCTG